MAGTAQVRRPTEETALRDLRPARISLARLTRLLTAARATADRHGQLLFSRALDRAHGPQDDACPLCGYWACRCGRGGRS